MSDFVKKIMSESIDFQTTPCTHLRVDAFVQYTRDGFVHASCFFALRCLSKLTIITLFLCSVHRKPIHGSSKCFSGLRKISRKITSTVEIVIILSLVTNR